MNPQLLEGLRQLNLQPGECRRVEVNGYTVEIRLVEEDAPSEFDDQVMLEPWVTFPFSSEARIVTAKPGVLPLPDPPVIPPDDEGME